MFTAAASTVTIAAMNLTTSANNNRSANEDCFEIDTVEAIPSPDYRALLIALYSCTALVALLGNVIVIVVQVTSRKSPSNVRIYLTNLAISDIIFSVLCVPFTYTDLMFGQWVLPRWLCRAAHYVQWLAVFVTACTMTLINVERYLATIHPFSIAHRYLARLSPAALAIEWTIGGVGAYAASRETSIRAFNSDGQIFFECISNFGAAQQMLFTGVSLLLTVLLPLVMMVFAYCTMLRQLFRAPPRTSMVLQFHAAGDASTTKIAHTNISNTNTTTTTTIVPISSPSSTAASTSAIGRAPLSSSAAEATAVLSKIPHHQIPSKCGPIELHQKSKPFRNRFKIIKMMFAIMTLYAACWLPTHREICVTYKCTRSC